MRPVREFARWLRRSVLGPPARSLETCLILPKSKIVYAYVPKAACSSIKAWLLRYSGESPDVAEQYHEAERAGKKFPDAHRAMQERFSARKYASSELEQALTSPDYFKFTFVRHPLRRVVSSYLDKIVNAKRIAHEFIAGGQIAAGCSQASLGGWWRAPRIDAERSLTFREFVHALATADQEALDAHFRAQHRILRGLEFDFVGKVENLPVDFRTVQDRLQVSVPLAWRHQTEYSVPVNGCVADWPASRFRNVAAPPWQAFFDDELWRLASETFAADFERFGYEATTSDRRAA